jgi:hypothetical protein
MIFSGSGNVLSVPNFVLIFVPNFPLKSYIAVAKRTGIDEEKLADGGGAGYSSA